MNTNSLRIMTKSVSAIPIPIEIIEPKITQVFDVVVSMVEIPPPFCPMCGKFITKNECGDTRFKWMGCPFNKHTKQLWGCDDLIVSFDGSCYIPKELNKTDKCWLHSDQAPISEGLQCIQGFVSITENTERTFVAYEGTHKMHHQYFKDKGIQNSKNWNRIAEDDVEKMKGLKRVLHVPAGALVIWDSRTFHQNQYGAPNTEERLVQYVCFLPENHPKNTKSMKTKRLKYYNERRTTSHWPCPIRVNSLQPQTYGDKSRLIDYSLLTPPNLECFESEIMKLL